MNTFEAMSYLILGVAIGVLLTCTMALVHENTKLKMCVKAIAGLKYNDEQHALAIGTMRARQTMLSDKLKRVLAPHLVPEPVAFVRAVEPVKTKKTKKRRRIK